jgi:hypothetical protein
VYWLDALMIAFLLCWNPRRARRPCTEVCTSKSDTLVTTLGPARQVYVFAYQETCQIGHRSRNTFLPGVSALSLLPVHTSVRVEKM